MRNLICIAILALSGCAVIAPQPETPVQGWPTLHERVHVVSAQEVHDMAFPRLPWYRKAMLPIIFAATRVDLYHQTCDIYLTSPDSSHYEHERQHCLGYDHDGTLQALYDRWKALGFPTKSKGALWTQKR